MTFNAKNLTYDANQPAFLSRLREKHGEGDSTRHERSLVRPKKQKIGEDEDDEPTYVHEESHDTISKHEYDALVNRIEVDKKDSTDVEPPIGTFAHPKGPPEDVEESPQDAIPSKQQVASIGGTAKRKLVKVVGDDDGTGEIRHSGEPPIQEKRSKMTKRKTIKLSFEEDVES